MDTRPNLKVYKRKTAETPFFTNKQQLLFGFCLIFLAVFMTSIGIMSDDYYWHISVGEWILEHKEIPMTGIFSWTASDTPWFAHEWLAEIVMYLFSLLGTEFGGWLYFTISVTLMYSMIYFMNKEKLNQNYMFGLIAWIFLIFATTIVGSARPHIFSISFFIYLLYSLEQLKQNENSKWIYVTPLITIIWANYHGGTIMFIPIFFLIYILSGLFNASWQKLSFKKLSKKQLKTLLIFFIINMTCICFNPHGIGLITYPFSYSNIATRYINEWQSPSFTKYPFVMVMIIAICIILFITKKKLNFTDLGILGTLMLMTLVYVRFEWWLAIAMIFILPKYAPYYGNQEYKSLKVISLLTMFVGIIIIMSPQYSFELSNIGLSSEAIEVLKTTDYENMFNTYDSGNTLIYNGFDVFLDGRSDMYQHKLSPDIYQDKDSENYDETKMISVLEEGMEFSSYNYKNMGDFIDKYKLDLFVISHNSRCNIYLASREDIDLIFEDDSILIYQKKS